MWQNFTAYQRDVNKALRNVYPPFLVTFFRFYPTRSEGPTSTAMDRWMKNKQLAIHTTMVSMAFITAFTSMSLFSIFQGNSIFRLTFLPFLLHRYQYSVA